jgi:2-dehydro-3-deoxyphosphogluconate aldolase/(4S)-4-hydroxy-2-oxoglutarate aldolase
VEEKMSVREQIESIGLVPVVVIDDASDAPATAAALKAGGIGVMEITLRTDAGLDSISAVHDSGAEVLVGAGTVLSLDKAKEAVNRGASFVVSPGFDADIVSWCIENGVDVYPGCVTPTEISAAVRLGLNTVKFFPANIYGGAKAIEALAGPFPGLRFIPTGGVDLSNLGDFMLPQVAAIGGGWLCPRSAIREKDFAAITNICADSVNAVKSYR